VRVVRPAGEAWRLRRPLGDDALLIVAFEAILDRPAAEQFAARAETDAAIGLPPANELGLTKAAALFEKTLKEEEATDDALTKIAESVVNQEAQQAAE
jgi:hypothetical protein